MLLLAHDLHMGNEEPLTPFTGGNVYLPENYFLAKPNAVGEGTRQTITGPSDQRQEQVEQSC